MSGSTLRPSPSGGLNPNAGTGMGTEVKSDTLLSDSDHRLERIWADYESNDLYITSEKVERREMDVKVEYMPPMISTYRPFQVSLCLIHLREHYSNGYILPVELHIPNRESTLRGSPHQRRAATEGASMISSLTCSYLLISFKMALR